MLKAEVNGAEVSVALSGSDPELFVDSMMLVRGLYRALKSKTEGEGEVFKRVLTYEVLDGKLFETEEDSNGEDEE